MEMKIKAIAGWFGGKRTMAPLIVQQLGEHVQYFEPFCGSMACLFAKKPSAHETVNDLHQDIVNLSLVLQDRLGAVELYERTQRTLFSEGLLEQAEKMLALPWKFFLDDRNSWSGERAYWYFLATWMGRNGVAGTAATDYQLAVRWTANGGTPTVRFRSCTESIPAWHERLKNVVILNRNAFDIIPKFDDTPNVAIYVDSPYTGESRGAGHGAGHSGTYLHEFSHTDDMFACDDHARLREQLGRFKEARVVVSHYDCPRIRELYKGWTFIDCARLKNLVQQNSRGQKKSKDAPEILIVNGREY
jgi:DNA adenine methylase